MTQHIPTNEAMQWDAVRAARQAEMAPIDRALQAMYGPIDWLLRTAVKVLPRAFNYYLGYEKSKTFTRTYYLSWFPIDMWCEQPERRDGSFTFKLDVAQHTFHIAFHAGNPQAKEKAHRDVYDEKCAEKEAELCEAEMLTFEKALELKKAAIKSNKWKQRRKLRKH